MAGIEWENYKRKRLHEVWEDLPQGHRLRIAFFDGSIPMKDYCFSPALAPAHVLAYYNRIVLKVWQDGKDIMCIVSRTEGIGALRKRKVA